MVQRGGAIRATNKTHYTQPVSGPDVEPKSTESQQEIATRVCVPNHAVIGTILLCSAPCRNEDDCQGLLLSRLIPR